MPAIHAINQELDQVVPDGRKAEERLSACADAIEDSLDPSTPLYGLLLARLTEAVLLTAGHYADNAEFTLAGDLLFNPRKINVYLRGEPCPVVKNRHGRLSEQFNTRSMPHCEFIRWFPRNAALVEEKPPLLPYLVGRMAESGAASPSYLDTCRHRMDKIPDAINFLAAWGVHCFEDLARKRAAMDEGAEQWLNRHLCAFQSDHFHDFGREIRHWMHRQEQGLRCPA